MVKIAINGFGRIGRNVFKVAIQRPDIDVIGINDLADNKTLAHLLKYDSTQGKFPGEVSYDDKGIIVDGKKIKISAEKSPSQIPWSDQPDIVIESTGVFRTKESDKGGYGDHIKNGAKKVILTAPAKDETDFVKTVVLGVNDHDIRSEDQFLSNASCTTNCIAPMAKLINDECGIENGYMTTIHAYTNGQALLDAPNKDLRRARSAALSLIPTTTGAASAVGKVIPELEGKLEGMAIRAPIPVGSLVDLVLNVSKDITVEQINEKMKHHAETDLKGILEYTEDPIVSADTINNPHSCIFDSLLTRVTGRMVKVLAWYDNEWGYSHRIVDLIEKVL